MLRLLFVSHSFPPAGRALDEANLGGMQRVATELHAALGRRDDVQLHDVLLRTSWEATHRKTPIFLLRVLREVAGAARARRVDAVLFSSMVTAATSILLRRYPAACNLPMAAIAHGRDVTLPVLPYQRLVVPATLRALDALLPVSRATGEEAVRRGLPLHELHVVPNGVDVERFPEPPEDRLAARRALAPRLGLDLPDRALLLVSVGRQVERKGFAWFTREVMPKLPPHVHYALAGEGPQHEAIAEAARAQGVPGRVHLLGRISDDDLTTLLHGGDLFVMPNRPVGGDMEGFGVVLLEAGLSGLPAVAARLEGIRDVVREGENGHFVETGDAPGFAYHIQRYDRDRQALAEASTRARRYVLDTFSWDAVAARYASVLHQLAGA